MGSILFLSVTTQGFSPELCVTITTISYGIGYITFAISIFLLCSFFLLKMSAFSYSHVLFQVLTALLQIFITLIPFQFKRFRKGMPFLTNKLNSFPLMIISILVLFSVLLLRTSTYVSYSRLYIFPYLFIFLFAIFIYISWKNNITKTYLDKLKEKDITELNASLLERERRMQDLVAENRELAKIIHSDNKLVPAMVMAVRDFIQDSSSLSPKASETGERLLSELDAMAEKRKGIIHEQDYRCRTIAATGMSSVDHLFTYMQQKAHEMDIELDVTVSCDMHALVKAAISEDDLNTLLADLLDNALIATQYNNRHHVLLNIDLVEKFYMISIFDSGIPFAKEVLLDLGVQGHTTHQEDGGSGIGLVTSYELIQKQNASLAIDEYLPDSGLYTKKVSVTFNHLRQYTLFTYRNAEDVAFLRQRADLLVVKKK
jgi:signal transduction histidine kinase